MFVGISIFKASIEALMYISICAQVEFLQTISKFKNATLSHKYDVH